MWGFGFCRRFGRSQATDHEVELSNIGSLLCKQSQIIWMRSHSAHHATKQSCCDGYLRNDPQPLVWPCKKELRAFMWKNPFRVPRMVHNAEGRNSKRLHAIPFKNLLQRWRWKVVDWKARVSQMCLLQSKPLFDASHFPEWVSFVYVTPSSLNGKRHSRCRKSTSIWQTRIYPLPHGLNPPLHEGFSMSGASFFGFGLADPRPRGTDRPLFAEAFNFPEHRAPKSQWFQF